MNLGAKKENQTVYILLALEKQKSKHEIKSYQIESSWFSGTYTKLSTDFSPWSYQFSQKCLTFTQKSDNKQHNQNHKINPNTLFHISVPSNSDITHNHIAKITQTMKQKNSYQTPEAMITDRSFTEAGPYQKLHEDVFHSVITIPSSSSSSRSIG